MDAWRGKAIVVTLAASGALATLVGLAMIDSSVAASDAASTENLVLGTEILQAAGEIVVLGGSFCLLGAVFVYAMRGGRAWRKPDRE